MKTRLTYNFVIISLFAIGTASVFAQNQVSIPDTLDLTVNAELSLNELSGTIDSNNHCEFLFGGTFVTPSLRHDLFSFSACCPKYIESFAMMRLMSDSYTGKTGERCARDYMMSRLGEDGLFYFRMGTGRPWDQTSLEDWEKIYSQWRILRSLLAMSQLYKSAVLPMRMAKLVNTLEKIAVYKEDYNYYPTKPLMVTSSAKTKVPAQSNYKKVSLRWLGNYMFFDSVKSGQQITIMFPMVIETETYTVRDFGYRGTQFKRETKYTIIFKGNTAVDIEPKDNSAMYPIYQCQYFLADKTPMKEAVSWETSNSIRW